jgi:hypothetical protein
MIYIVLKKYNNEKLFRMCEKIVGREDKKILVTVVAAYNNNKINKDILTLCAILIINCAKLS